MPKTLIRIVAALLVPCLIADAAAASGLNLAGARLAASPIILAQSFFAEQALADRLAFTRLLSSFAGKLGLEKILSDTHRISGRAPQEVAVIHLNSILTTVKRTLQREALLWSYHPIRAAIAIASLVLAWWHPA